MLLTAAQSIFAVAVVLSLSLSIREALLLFGLFAVTFVVPSTEVRLAAAFVYLGLTVIIVVMQRAELPAIWRSARETLAETNAAVAERHAAPRE